MRRADCGARALQVRGVLDAMPSTNLKPEGEDEVLDENVIYRTTYMFRHVISLVHPLEMPLSRLVETALSLACPKYPHGPLPVHYGAQVMLSWHRPAAVRPFPSEFARLCCKPHHPLSC